MADIEKSFEESRREINDEISKKHDSRISLFTSTNLTAYFSQFPKAVDLICKEPEILLFLGIQWVTVIVAYLLWSQFFSWIPDDVWEAISKSDNDFLINLIFMVWSFLVVALASYPLAICNSAIVAVHNLNKCGESSTTFKALALSMRYIDKIWIFSAIDNWITVNAILDRLPGGESRRTIADEFLFYAWKIATITVVPSLLCGKGFSGAAKDAAELFKKNPKELLSLRIGYSAACWVIGVGVYSISTIMMCSMVRYFSDKPTFYIIILVIGIPVVITAAVVILFLRPAFLLGVAQIYNEHFDVRSETKLTEGETPTNLLFDLKITVFFFVLFAVLFAGFFAKETGLAAWVEAIARASV